MRFPLPRSHFYPHQPLMTQGHTVTNSCPVKPPGRTTQVVILLFLGRGLSRAQVFGRGEAESAVGRRTKERENE